MTKEQFEAALAENGASIASEPRIEIDGDYKYECFDNADGVEIGFIAWRGGEPNYVLHPIGGIEA
jgi:hypothetical protein